MFDSAWHKALGGTAISQAEGKRGLTTGSGAVAEVEVEVEEGGHARWFLAGSVRGRAVSYLCEVCYSGLIQHGPLLSGKY